MKRSHKILLGVASIWPIVSTLLFVAFVIGIIIFTGAFGPRPINLPTDKPLNPELAGPITLAFAIYALTMLFAVGLKIFFVIHVTRHPSLSSNTKTLWVSLLFFAGIFAEPFYWYLNIWRDERTSSRALGSDRRPGPSQSPDWR